MDLRFDDLGIRIHDLDLRCEALHIRFCDLNRRMNAQIKTKKFRFENEVRMFGFRHIVYGVKIQD